MGGTRAKWQTRVANLLVYGGIAVFLAWFWHGIWRMLINA
jgi:hypothetical protein